jgi:hypothetical protein
MLRKTEHHFILVAVMNGSEEWVYWNELVHQFIL